MRKFLILIFLLFLIQLFSFVKAENSFYIVEPVSKKSNVLERVLQNIKDTLRGLAAIVAIVFIILGGYQMITAAGNPENFEKGKRSILYAIIGLIIVLIVDYLVKWVQNLVK